MHHMLATHARAWLWALHELIMDCFLPVGPAWERERPQLQLIMLPHRNTSEVSADTSIQTAVSCEAPDKASNSLQLLTGFIISQLAAKINRPTGQIPPAS